MTKDSRETGEKDLARIDLEIARAKLSIKWWIFLCFLFFVCWIILWGGGFVVGSPALAGTVGDFFGGLVNPVVALLAFYWLTKGVRMQQKELSETRSALDDQVKYARTSARIEALSSMINAHTSDIAYRREHLQFLISQKVAAGSIKGPSAFFSARGKSLDNTQLNELIKSLNVGINLRTNERVKFAGELYGILIQTRSSEEAALVRSTEVGSSRAEDDGAP